MHIIKVIFQKCSNIIIFLIFCLQRMRMNELLSATVSQDDEGGGVSGWITVREHKTGSTGTCKLAFSGNKVLDLLR